MTASCRRDVVDDIIWFSISYTNRIPFLKGCNCPLVDLMPSGAITMQI